MPFLRTLWFMWDFGSRTPWESFILIISKRSPKPGYLHVITPNFRVCLWAPFGTRSTIRSNFDLRWSWIIEMGAEGSRFVVLWHGQWSFSKAWCEGARNFTASRWMWRWDELGQQTEDKPNQGQQFGFYVASLADMPGSSHTLSELEIQILALLRLCRTFISGNVSHWKMYASWVCGHVGKRYMHEG